MSTGVAIGMIVLAMNIGFLVGVWWASSIKGDVE
jgi:uncharacterized protein YneF (UPF0154 family)